MSAPLFQSGQLKSVIGRLRLIAFIEGMSYLLLLFVAMPLKYFAGIPMAVTVTGGAHGALFIAFCLALLQVFLVEKWSIFRAAGAFIAALLPFGTFVLDKSLARDQKSQAG